MALPSGLFLKDHKMLYVLTGSDIVKAKTRAAALSKGYEVVRFGEVGEPFQNVLGYLSARGLFAPKVALVLDRPLQDPEGKVLFEEHGKELMEGDALVVVIEDEMNAATKKKIPKDAKIETFDLAEKTDAPPPNVFALTDAFAEGNRKNAWVLYRRLIKTGSAPEEIHGALMWQARALVLASKTKNAEEAGLKPFVYSKAKRATSRLGIDGAEELSRSLVHLVHQSRLGGGDLEDLLEAFLLKKI